MPSVSPLSTGLFETHVQRARGFLAEGKADLAEKDLAEAYLLKPRDVTVLSLLGVLYFKQGRLERAEDPVPDDQDSAVVPIQVFGIRAVMNSMVRRRS